MARPLNRIKPWIVSKELGIDNRTVFQSQRYAIASLSLVLSYIVPRLIDYRPGTMKLNANRRRKLRRFDQS